MSKIVKILKSAFDEAPDGKIVLRGHINPATLSGILVDMYQRETLPKTVQKIRKSLEEGVTLPDVELGMRGQSFQEKDGVIYLLDPVYVIDGLQRISAGKQLLEEKGDIPYIGVLVHFDTNVEWERERFKALNQERTKLSPSVLLRNLSYDYEAVAIVYRLTTEEKHFVLYQRVAWQQVMHRQEIVTATIVAKAIELLHTQIESSNRTQTEVVAKNLQTIMETIGEDTYVSNLKRFYGLIDEAFGIRAIAYRDLATQLRGSFLYTLARVLSDHLNFWDGNNLVVDLRMVKRISQFPIGDPQVRQLIATNGNINAIIYSLLVDHLNKGRKQTDRLQRRRGGTENELQEIIANPE